MAIKFNSLTFDIKDLILIVGVVAYVFRSENRQIEQFNELKTEIQQIISDNKVQEVKVNARFDAMLNKQTSHKETDTKSMINFIAVVHDNRIQVVKKRLVKLWI